MCVTCLTDFTSVQKFVSENASILIATPDALSSILVMKGKEIAHYFDTTRVVIIDDIASLLKDFMNHHQLSFIFKNIFENSGIPNHYSLFFINCVPENSF